MVSYGHSPIQLQQDTRAMIYANLQTADARVQRFRISELRSQTRIAANVRLRPVGASRCELGKLYVALRLV